MSIDIEGSVVVLTGASGGLGTGLARELAGRGARLALVARREEPLVALAESIVDRGGSAVAIAADVTDGAARGKIVDETTRRLGPVDILVNNAGIGRATSFLDEDPVPILNTNLVGPVALTREIVGGMVERGRGHVLTVSSLAALGLPYLVDYSASKAALAAFSTGLREELRGTGVSTTVVAPGFLSDSGIYVAYRTPVPWFIGTNTTAVIARKVVDALERDRAEVILNGLPLRPMLALKTISEPVFRTIVRVLGLTRYMASVADEHVQYDGTTGRPILDEGHAPE